MAKEKWAKAKAEEEAEAEAGRGTGGGGGGYLGGGCACFWRVVKLLVCYTIS